jgi:hypothetical protein
MTFIVLCSDGRAGSLDNFCVGYVEGVADAIDVVNALNAHGMTLGACPFGGEGVRVEQGAGVRVEQVRDVVVQWLTAHPELRHLSAAEQALWALATAFPCKQ